MRAAGAFFNCPSAYRLAILPRRSILATAGFGQAWKEHEFPGQPDVAAVSQTEPFGQSELVVQVCPQALPGGEKSQYPRPSVVV